MMNEDELLERLIRAQERGSASQVTQPTDGDLADLARLAKAIHHLPHPSLQPEQTRRQRRALLAEVSRANRAGASQLTNPFARRHGNSATPPRPQPSRATARRQTRSWMLVPAAAGFMLVLLMGVLALLGASLWISGPRNSQSAVLEGIQGQVEVAAVDWSNPRRVTEGAQLLTGERLRTAAGSQASLVFFDGSRTTIGPNSDVTLSRIDGDWGKVLRVVMIQTAGQTDHQVVPMKGNKGYFLVFTPSGEVSVHGTRFNIEVDPHGNARFAVDKGRVLVTDSTSEVFLEPGQATVSGPAEDLLQTGYQFTLQGKLNGKQGRTWRVAGVNFLIRETTNLSQKFKAGTWVAVNGRILSDGTWIADSIQKASGSDRLLSYDGQLQQVNGNQWQVGDLTISFGDSAELPQSPELGSTVRVSLRRMTGGNWEGKKVEILEEPAEEPSPTPTETPEPGAEPDLAFQPESLQSPVCQGSVELSANLVNLAQEQDDIAQDVLLGYQLTQVGAEYVDGVQLLPQSWDAISPAGQVPFKIAVDLDDDGWKAAPDGSEVKIRVFVAHETNNQDAHGDMEVTLVKDCAEEPTETPTETPIETQTGTPTGTVTGSPEPSATPGPTGTVTVTPGVTQTPVTSCTGANPHPTGQKLAARFGVPYEEIMGWFCQHFGFGEIDLAYDLSRQSGVPVTTIFDLRKSGLGWGEIKKLVWGLPTGTPVAPVTGTPEVTPSGTPELTPTGTLTPEPSETPESPQKPKGGKKGACAGGKPHPTALSIAQRFGVPYEEILGWFCQGYNFGEINLAYELSHQTGASANEIFDMRLSGMKWSEIRKQLLGDNPGGIFENDGDIEEEKGNGKGVGPGNPGGGNGGNDGGNKGGNGGGNGGGKPDKGGGKKDK